MSDLHVISPSEAHLRDDLRELLVINNRQLIADAAADTDESTVMLAYILASGRAHWRQRYMREFGFAFVGNVLGCHHLADRMFACFEEIWHKKHGETLPKTVLDRYPGAPSPPTEQEIEDAWELEIMSDERNMAQNYEGSARVRKGAWLGSRQRG